MIRPVHHRDKARQLLLIPFHAPYSMQHTMDALNGYGLHRFPGDQLLLKFCEQLTDPAHDLRVLTLLNRFNQRLKHPTTGMDVVQGQTGNIRGQQNRLGRPDIFVLHSLLGRGIRMLQAP